MRHDIAYGLVISGLLHAAAFFGDTLFPSVASRAPAGPATTTVALLELPALIPDDPDPVTQPEEFVKETLTPPPPTLVDVPQVRVEGTFLQNLQPPSIAAPPSSGMVTIPADYHRTPGFGPAVFDPASLDQQPVPRSQPAPFFPSEMRRQGLGGEVLVAFIVDAAGNVQEARAASSTHREFEAAAVQAVSKWKFKPGRKAGRNVNTRMQAPIAFTLEGS